MNCYKIKYTWGTGYVKYCRALSIPDALRQLDEHYAYAKAKPIVWSIEHVGEAL